MALCSQQALDKGLLVKKLESEDRCQMLPMENTMITIYATTQKSLVSENETNLVWAAQNGDLEAFNQLVLFYQDRVFPWHF